MNDITENERVVLRAIYNWSNSDHQKAYNRLSPQMQVASTRKLKEKGLLVTSSCGSYFLSEAGIRAMNGNVVRVIVRQKK